MDPISPKGQQGTEAGIVDANDIAIRQTPKASFIPSSGDENLVLEQDDNVLSSSGGNADVKALEKDVEQLDTQKDAEQHIFAPTSVQQAEDAINQSTVQAQQALAGKIAEGKDDALQSDNGLKPPTETVSDEKTDNEGLAHQTHTEAIQDTLDDSAISIQAKGQNASVAHSPATETQTGDVLNNETIAAQVDATARPHETINQESERATQESDRIEVLTVPPVIDAANHVETSLVSGTETGDKVERDESVNGKVVLGKDVDEKIVDANTVEENAVEEKSVDGNTVDGNTVDGNTVDGNTVDGNTVDGNTVEEKAVDEIIAKDRASEDKPAEDKPVEDEDAEDKDAEDKDAEDKDAEDKDAEDKDAEDKDAEDKDAEDKDAEDTAADNKAAENTAANDRIADDAQMQDLVDAPSIEPIIETNETGSTLKQDSDAGKGNDRLIDPSQSSEDKGSTVKEGGTSGAELLVPKEEAHQIVDPSTSTSKQQQSPSAKQSPEPLVATHTTEQQSDDNKPNAAEILASTAKPLEAPSAAPLATGVVVSPEKALSVASPATPAVLASSVEHSSALQAPPLIAKQIAILLKINKELIRLCVELQAKELIGDPIFRTAASRLQANLAFLASLADPLTAATNNADGTKTANAVVLNDEPFPDSPLARDTLLPKLYVHLRSLSGSAATAHNDQSEPTSPTATGKKRRRESDADQDQQTQRKAPSTSARRSASNDNRSPNAGSNPTGPSGGKQERRRKSSVTTTSLLTSPSVSAAQPPAQTENHASSPFSRVSAAQSAASMGAAAPSPQTVAQALSNGTNAHESGSVAAPSPAASAQATALATPQANGMRAAGPTPQQLQSLVQAFGQNAVPNLNALQLHYRAGQTQPIIAYMEANVPNFRTMPLQLQLQHMANTQNAAMQRQRQASLSSNSGGGGPSSASSPIARQHTPQAPPTPGAQPRPSPMQRRPSAAPSPASLTGDSAIMQRNTQSPMAAPMNPFQAQTSGSMHSQPSAPQTPASMAMPFGSVAASPAASVASPGVGSFAHMMPNQQQQQQTNPFGFSAPPQQQQQQQAVPFSSQAQQFMASLPSSFAGMPAHLQQQLFQHFMMQQQQQQQQQPQQTAQNLQPQLTTQPMAPPHNPMMAAMMQQQQQQQQQQQSMHAPTNHANANANPGASPDLANLWASVQQQNQPSRPPSGGS